jgi:hypothetical protein
LERNEMKTFRRHSQSSLRSVFMPTLLLAMAALLSGCTAPLIQRTYPITVLQIGFNSVDSEVLKETQVSPQLKASLK